ncbi:MAG: hypothetical protein OXF01_09155 [Gemmatimonadetes bacterium]|nr:hypothetical protein [Gemmatimonadota bacterium]
MVPFAPDQRFLPPLPIPTGRTAARTAGIAWGAGSAAALAGLCAVLVIIACARRRWPRGRIDGTHVYLSRRFGPALVGIVAPTPVIPAWVLETEPDARAAILHHEREHARARDHLALLYAGLVAAAFPWSPAIWWMCRRLRAAIEIDCDRRVITGGIGAADYGAVLLHAGSRSQGRWGFAPALSQPRSLLERRLRTMSEKRKKLNAAHGALLAAAALVALGIACDMPAPTELDEAIEEAIADGPNADDALAGLRAAGPQPLVFVDGVRVEDLAAAIAGSRVQSASSGLILGIRVIKGPEATTAYGEEAANGVVNVYTRDAQAEYLYKFTGSNLSITRDRVGYTISSLTQSFSLTSPDVSYSGMSASFTTNPGEHLLYETAQAVDWPAKAQAAQETGENSQRDDAILALVGGLLESPEVVQGAILFSKTGDVLGRISVMKDDEE